MQEENLCVLIDFENIAAGTEREGLGKFNLKLVLNRLKEKGRILIARAYGDWGRFARFKQTLLEHSITMVELTSYRGQEKNRADIALVVDAMEISFTRPHINTFILLSGDSDFTPLVMKLRELNKRIIGLGTRKATSKLLSNTCDEFIFYDNLLKRSDTEEESVDDTQETPQALSAMDSFVLLVETVRGAQKDENSPIPAGQTKQLMLRKVPTFDEADYGYAGFGDFLEDAKHKNFISLISDAKLGVLVSLLAEAPSEADSEESNPSAPRNPIANKWRDVLIKIGYHPTSHIIRHTVVHEFVDHVIDRKTKKKRNTLVFTYGDIARRCRKTDPVANTTQVQAVLNALHSAGELFGTDNKPIRSKKANFVLQKDPEELLESLRVFYVRLLQKQGLEITNAVSLSDLLWDDMDHVVECEKLLQNLQDTPTKAIVVPISEDADDTTDATPSIEATEQTIKTDAEATEIQPIPAPLPVDTKPSTPNHVKQHNKKTTKPTTNVAPVVVETEEAKMPVVLAPEEQPSTPEPVKGKKSTNKTSKPVAKQAKTPSKTEKTGAVEVATPTQDSVANATATPTAKKASTPKKKPKNTTKPSST